MELFRMHGTIVADDKPATKAIKAVDQEAKRSASTMKSYTASVKGFSNAISSFTTGLMGLFAIKKIVDISSDLLKATNAQEKAETRLETTMRNVVGTTEEQIKSIKALSAVKQQYTTIGDEVQIAGASQLATFQLQAETIQTLIPGFQDLAVAAYGVNVSQEQMINMGNLLGKAMMGQVGALTRYGVSLSDAQAEVIKMGTEQEKAAMLSQVLKENFGGLAESMARDREGELQRTANAWGDWKELLGEFVGIIVDKALPAINWLIDKSSILLKWLTGHKQTTEEMAREYETLASKENLSVKEKERLNTLSRELADILPDVAGGIDEETKKLKVNTEELIKNARAKDINNSIVEIEKEIRANEKLIEAYRQRQEEIKASDAGDFYSRQSEYAQTYLQNMKKAFVGGLQFEPEEFDSLIDQVLEGRDQSEFRFMDFIELGGLEPVKRALDSIGASYEEIFAPEKQGFFELAQESAQFTDEVANLDSKIQSLTQSNSKLNQKLTGLKQVITGEMTWEEYNKSLEIATTKTEEIIEVVATASNATGSYWSKTLQEITDQRKKDQEEQRQLLNRAIDTEFERGNVTLENYKKELERRYELDTQYYGKYSTQAVATYSLIQNLNDQEKENKAESQKQIQESIQQTAEAIKAKQMEQAELIEKGVKFEYEQGVISLQSYRIFLDEKMKLLEAQGLKYSDQWQSIYSTLAQLDQADQQRQQASADRLKSTLDQIIVERQANQQKELALIEAGIKFEYEQGVISEANYLQYLNDRLAKLEEHGQKYSAEWLSIFGEIKGIKDENAKEEEVWDVENRKRLENQIEFEYKNGQKSTEEYLDFFRQKLEGYEKFTDEWIQINSLISQIEDEEAEKRKNRWKETIDYITKTVQSVMNTFDLSGGIDILNQMKGIEDQYQSGDLSHKEYQSQMQSEESNLEEWGKNQAQEVIGTIGNIAVDGVAALTNTLIPGAGVVVKGLADIFSGLFNLVSTDDWEKSFDVLLDNIEQGIGDFINKIGKVAMNLPKIFMKIGASIVEILVNIVLEVFEEIVNGIITVINWIPGVNIRKVDWGFKDDDPSKDLPGFGESDEQDDQKTTVKGTQIVNLTGKSASILADGLKPLGQLLEQTTILSVIQKDLQKLVAMIESGNLVLGGSGGVSVGNLYVTMGTPEEPSRWLQRLGRISQDKYDRWGVE